LPGCLCRLRGIGALFDTGQSIPTQEYSDTPAPYILPRQRQVFCHSRILKNSKCHEISSFQKKKLAILLLHGQFDNTLGCSLPDNLGWSPFGPFCKPYGMIDPLKKDVPEAAAYSCSPNHTHSEKRVRNMGFRNNQTLWTETA